MSPNKRIWYGIGLAILGAIIYFIVGGEIGLIFFIIGLVSLASCFLLYYTRLGKKIIKQKSEKVEEAPIETEVVEPEEETEKENIE